MKLKGFLILACMLVCRFADAATFVVTNTNDSGAGSLRNAINLNNASAGPNLISFDIPGTGPFVIQPLTDLPQITTTVTIDGYTQPGATPNTITPGTNANLLIVINGSNYTVGDGVTSGNGLLFAEGSDSSVVRGLVINEWIGVGIVVLSNSASVVGNFIGTTPNGSQVAANASGVTYASIGGNIGTPNLADVNLIAGSFSYFIQGSAIQLEFASNVSVTNNIVGLDPTGTSALGGSTGGIFIFASSGCNVNQNTISGQTITGIYLLSATNSRIYGNYIGTDISGTKAIGNAFAGVYFDAQDGPNTGNSIVGNVISGNGKGIVLGSAFFSSGTYDNVIAVNLVGTNSNGTAALGNIEDGIVVHDSNNRIEGNVFSGNGHNGILICSSASNTAVSNNFIGTDYTGSSAIPNGKNGIQLGTPGGKNSAINNVIGNNPSNPSVSLGNVISGNAKNGIEIQCFSSGNSIIGNNIGTGFSTTLAIPNGKNGIEIVNSFDNQIGINYPAPAGNVIAFNRHNGVEVGDSAKDRDSVANSILNNSIYGNKCLGINLHKPHAPAVVEPNSKGPNRFQTSPNLQSASLNGSSIRVKGSLKSTASTSYVIQFFGNKNDKPGQGAVYLGQITVKTNYNEGKASFAATLDIPTNISGIRSITSTATRLGPTLEATETSEFSEPISISHNY